MSWPRNSAGGTRPPAALASPAPARSAGRCDATQSSAARSAAASPPPTRPRRSRRHASLTRSSSSSSVKRRGVCRCVPYRPDCSQAPDPTCSAASRLLRSHAVASDDQRVAATSMPAARSICRAAGAQQQQARAEERPNAAGLQVAPAGHRPRWSERCRTPARRRRNHHVAQLRPGRHARRVMSAAAEIAEQAHEHEKRAPAVPACSQCRDIGYRTLVWRGIRGHAERQRRRTRTARTRRDRQTAAILCKGGARSLTFVETVTDRQRIGSLTGRQLGRLRRMHDFSRPAEFSCGGSIFCGDDETFTLQAVCHAPGLRSAIAHGAFAAAARQSLEWFTLRCCHAVVASEAAEMLASA